MESCTLLLSAGADSTIVRYKTGHTALHLAIAECCSSQHARYDQHAIVKLLTDNAAPESLNHSAADRDTPLLTAIRNGFFAIAKWLLDVGSSPNMTDRYNYSPLSLLCHVYHDFVKMRKKGDSGKKQLKSEDSSACFELISADELFDVFLNLPKEMLDVSLVNNRGETVFHLALHHNLQDFAKRLSRRVVGKASVLRQLNMDGYSVLHMLARGKQDQIFAIEIISLLLSSESSLVKEIIDVRAKDDSTAIYSAITQKKLELVKCLAEKGADVLCVCNGETLLHAAARSGKVESVSFCIKNGIEVNAFNRDYWSALHLAAAGHSKDVMMTLMLAEGDVNLPSKPDRYSPFFIAVRNAHLDLVEIMLPSAKLDQLTRYGETAMTEAARSGNIAILSTLVAACGDKRTEEGKRFLDLYSSRGKPPLVAAAERGHKKAVEMLLKNGANPNLVILDGNSALYAAIGNGQIATVRLLLAWGADLTVVNKCGPRLCCFSYVDPHPHLEMSPFFSAAKFQNLNVSFYKPLGPLTTFNV